MSKKRSKSDNKCRITEENGSYTITTPSLVDLMDNHSIVAQQAARKGNASGVHGDDKYGKKERRQNKQEECDAKLLKGEIIND